MTRRPALLGGVTALLLAAVPSLGAGAQEPDQPQLVVEPASAAPGEAVVLTISGFRAHNVTVTVCGNAAARGSVDCNQGAGEGMGLRDEVTRREHVVEAPPVPCPCVLRVASRTQDEVAIAPFELLGHPVGDVVRSETSRLVDVSVEARRAPEGVLGHLRSALGGPTVYEVEVTVHNRSGLPLEGVTVATSARRGASEHVADVDLPEVGPLAPGGTWSHVTTATMPAPVIGSVVWEATASGAGPAVADTSSSRSVPYLLLILVALLVGDLVAIVMRRLARRRVWSRRAAGRVPQPA